MYKIYARPGAGNVAVEALLAELGVPHEVITLERDELHQLPESFRAINPMRQVPALVLPDGTIMTESAAMMIYLADLFPAKALAPAASSASRPHYLRWMVFLSANLYNADLMYFYAQRYSTDAGHAEGIKAKAAMEMERQFGIVADAVGKGPYILGNDFSAVDIYAAMLFTWAPDVAALALKHPNLKAHHDRIAARPAIAPVWARNKMN
jgi:glutathione S-transferase